MVEKKSKRQRGDRTDTAAKEWLGQVVCALRKLQKANSTNRDVRGKEVEAAIGPLDSAWEMLEAYRTKHGVDTLRAAECQDWIRFAFRDFRKGYGGLWDALACPEFIGELERWKNLEETGQEVGTALPRAETQAYQSYECALREKPELADATDDAVYDWLKENGTEGDYELPSRETWERQVRGGRKYHRKQKNTRRAGRDARSTIKSDQIQSLPEISSQYDDEAD